MKTKKDKMVEIFRNNKHVADLQFRLDNIAKNAKKKGKRKAIGSTMPYAVVRDRELKLNKQLKDRQFGKFVSVTTGKSYTYLKDGCYVDR